jgi:Protein tyrosine/serine phosphatase
MARKVMANLPFKLEGAKNCRDLGGYPTKYGVPTATGQFLRADNPSKFTEADKARLYTDYGVRAQLDLRSDDEIAREPSALDGYKDLDYRALEMMDGIHSAGGAASMATLGDLYISLLDYAQPNFLKVFKGILAHLDDCVFFNCTAGKDRTGTTAMLLLKLAGVSDEDVVIDYQATGPNIYEDMLVLYKFYTEEKGMKLDFDMLESKPHHMERALKYLNEKYGTVENWLKIIGLTDDEIEKVRNKMLGR